MKNILEVPTPTFNVEPFVAKDCQCNMLGSSTLRTAEGGNKNKFGNSANTFNEGYSLKTISAATVEDQLRREKNRKPVFPTLNLGLMRPFDEVFFSFFREGVYKGGLIFGWNVTLKNLWVSKDS